MTKTTEKIIKKYFEMPDGRKEWSVTGDSGSISFWVCETVSEIAIKSGECWHDGTSLWASEYWIPHILPLGHDAIWERLVQAYRENFKRDESEAA